MHNRRSNKRIQRAGCRVFVLMIASAAANTQDRYMDQNRWLECKFRVGNNSWFQGGALHDGAHT